MNDIIQFLHTDTGSFLLEFLIGSTFILGLAHSLRQGDE